MEREKRKSDKAKEFVEKHWPDLVLAGTIVGASIWLVARYIKERKDRNSDDQIKLNQLESEALTITDETSVLLETGTEVSKIAGSDMQKIKDELTPHLTNEKAKSTLEVLNNFASMENNKKKK